MPFLSKSKYIAGLQCAKLLWYHYNARDRIPPYDESTQAVFDQGHRVGELAKSLFPGGVEIAGSHTEFEEVLRRSAEALKMRRPLFEPAFRYRDAYARADIISPAGADRWDIIEVKSSTSVKDVYLQDLALQKYTYVGAGLDIRKSVLLHIDSGYERLGEVEPEKIFVREDVSRQVDALVPEVEGNLRKMADMIRMENHPAVPVGPWCSEPYSCPLTDLCWDFLPDPSIFDLTRIGKKGFDLLGKGVTAIEDLPRGFRLSDNQALQVRAFKSGRPFINRPAIREFLRTLAYPLYFLDFETLGTAIPLFDHVRPFQQVPFQFSLHIVKKPKEAPEHHEFLWEGREDPRPELLAELFPLLRGSGSIVSYNASFEKRILKESCRTYADFDPSWKSAELRFVDLWGPFRSFHYYHPDQRGSASMKEVLPALTGMGYGGMEIADGGTASREYLRVTFGDVPAGEKLSVQNQLKKYCSLDTSGMVAIVEALKALVR